MKFLPGCIFTLAYFVFTGSFLRSAAQIPQPDHVVVLVLENHSYNQIAGSPAAPYINSLVADDQAAVFSQSYGLTRPSQPNYLQMFSGSTQGVTSNDVPAGVPFNTPNIGAQLLAASKTFIGYSESLPFAGYTGETSGAYARKHNPWVNWQGSGVNQLPASCNQPFTSFPSDFNLLPDLAFVVPNEDNDMHNGSDPATITVCDTWIQNNLDAYVQWAKTNNSLFIITFDEDNFIDQHIFTMIIGEHVQHGTFPDYIDHYSLLRLMEDFFGLPYIGEAANAEPIDYCWTYCDQPTVISPSGPLTICEGSQEILTASSGSSYQWSNGKTTQSIVVSEEGRYTVTVTDAQGCISTSSPVIVKNDSFSVAANVFIESFGFVTVNTSVNQHELNNGFDNDALTMSGTAEIRASSPSSGYAGSTAGGNVFFTNTPGRDFIVSNINTAGLINLELSFGIFKSLNAADGSDLEVSVSADGVNFTPLNFSLLPTGAGTAFWFHRTATGNIPAASNLRIRFVQNSSTTQYRIDDLKLSYSYATPYVTADGPLIFCQGGSVNLSASPAHSYQWSNGMTSKNITVNSSGVFYVIESSMNGCKDTSGVIEVTSAAPVIQSFIPDDGPAGSVVTVTGSHLTNISSVMLDSYPADFITVNADDLRVMIPQGSTGYFSVTNPCGTEVSQDVFTFLQGSPVLNLKLYIEGYYMGGGMMREVLGQGMSDTVVTDFHSTVAPYEIIFSEKKILNTDGSCTFQLDGKYYGREFFLVVYNRNTIETWSSEPVEIGMVTFYDFTNAISKAFGNNMKNLGDGYFALYSGDVNQDRVIDESDYQGIMEAIMQFDTGYMPQDLTGDYIIESSDLILFLNHGLQLISIHP